MAPALTEATSASLKLQEVDLDLPSKTEILKTIEPLESKALTSVSDNKEIKPLNTKSITNFSHYKNHLKEKLDKRGSQFLSHNQRERKSVNFSKNLKLGDSVHSAKKSYSNLIKHPPRRPTPPTTNKTTASTVYTSKTKIDTQLLTDQHSKSVAERESLKLKCDNFYKVPEDFQIDPNKNSFDNLKIMNQQPFAAEKQDSSHPKIDVNSLLDNKPDTSVMVNGGSGNFTRKFDDEECLNGCNEKGDADFHPHNFGRVKFKSTDNSIKKSKMGVYIKEDKSYLPLSFKSKFSIEEITAEEKLTEERRKACIKKQAHLERRVDALVRRLKRMKGKVVETHSKEQLRQFVNYHHKNLQKVAKNIKKETPGPEALKEHFLSNEDVKNMSTAQLVKLVKSYQSKSVDTLDNFKTSAPSRSAVSIDPSVRIQSSLTSDRLAHRVDAAKAELDSDATASSSGGESGDEDNIPVPRLTEDITLPPL